MKFPIDFLGVWFYLGKKGVFKFLRPLWAMLFAANRGSQAVKSTVLKRFSSGNRITGNLGHHLGQGLWIEQQR